MNENNESTWGSSSTLFFNQLDPNQIMNAIERLGVRCSGRILPLNSMENRVYDIEKEEPENYDNISDASVIAKFYRPGRWTREQIQEEHDFLYELLEEDIPVIAPLKFEGESLFFDEKTSLLYCLFPKKGGRIKDEISEKETEILGRLIARLHSVGARKKSLHRPALNPITYGESNINWLLQANIMPDYFQENYKIITTQILEKITPLWTDIKTQRVHGDCHWGNIIWRDEGPYLIDFDDMVTAPIVQDIWLMNAGKDQESLKQKDLFLDSYEQMYSFPFEQLELIEPLRSLRLIHYTAWIARRWEDKSFQKSFPHFKTDHYWESHLQDLRHQLVNEQYSDY